VTDAPQPIPNATPETPPVHRRRPRYAGKYPRHFKDKYKEHDPARYAATVAKVVASGKTPAGTHRPILTAEILEVLAPQPGEFGVDCTLGFGGHAQALLARLVPGGHLLGLDADPIEMPKTEVRLRALGFGTEILTTRRSNFAGLPEALAAHFVSRTPAGEAATVTMGADLVLADLGVSSMQIDDPMRGFSVKWDGPLDMRMNPRRGEPASALLAKLTPDALAALLAENADEPHAAPLADALAGKTLTTTRALAEAVRNALPRLGRDGWDLAVRRVFQALRIAVNDEFGALGTLLRRLPACLNPGGRVAILTFHSGEDRRVKRAFESGLRVGDYSQVSDQVVRPTQEEIRSNPRAAPAKLRWARR
jgi:16S rRNA (cytosine1402-N4)-methyltransferase